LTSKRKKTVVYAGVVHAITRQFLQSDASLPGASSRATRSH